MTISIDPVAVTVFGSPIRWYGLFFSGGLAVTWLSMRAKINYISGITSNTIDRGMFWISIGAVIGGRLGDAIFFSTATIMSDPKTLLDFRSGGMSFHGGYVGVIVAIYFFCKVNRLDWQLADLTACSAPLGLMLGRIGNFLNGEIYGPRTNISIGLTIDGIRRHPTQLYEAVFEGGILFMILYFMIPKFFSYKRALLSGLFTLLYAIARFFLDYLRPEEIVLIGLRISQILCIFMMVVGSYLIYYSIRINEQLFYGNSPPSRIP
jgi:phosphatidylglycerol:prolipoprotein diacylglycerol transferase